MKHFLIQRILITCLSTLVGIGIWAIAPDALAYNAPELLPTEPTSIIDLADSLTPAQQEKLDQHLEDFERETGWKLRVLTQFDRTPGRAVKDFWQLDDRSVLLVSDTRSGNILNFNIGDAAYQLLPRTYWMELQARFGNQYFVRDNGQDQSILQALESVEYCLRKDGCNVVPGLPTEQWIFTLIASILGGVICGVAAHPHKPGQVFSWKWVLAFSPLWALFFFAYGIAPVVSRTADWLPLTRNIAGFMIGCLVAYLGAPSPTSTSETG